MARWVTVTTPLTIVSGELCILLESLTGLIRARNRGWVLLLQISRLAVLCVMISLVNGDHRERELSWNIKSPPSPAALKDHNLSPMKGHSLFLWSVRGRGGWNNYFLCDYYDLWRGEPSPVTVADTDQLITFSPGWGSLTGISCV